MRRTREEGHFRWMAAHDVRQRRTADDGKVIPVLLDDLEIRRELVVTTRGLREEVPRHETKVVLDGEHAAGLRVWRQRRSRLRRLGERGQHRIEEGQRQRNTR